MSLTEFARVHARALRLLLAVVLLGFAASSIAHLTHRHDATTSTLSEQLACGYCVSFGAMADAPAQGEQLDVTACAVLARARPRRAEPHSQVQTAARPRAPPLS